MAQDDSMAKSIAPDEGRADSVPSGSRQGRLPSISVIIPIYNTKRYLDACLDSLAAQTIENIEMVCVNDGSTDDSLAILERRRADDERIVIVDKPNGGLSSARNAGIRAASAPYICFLDSDDRFTPNACERILREFERTQADVVTFGGYCVPDSVATPWLRLKLSPRDVVYNQFSPDLMFKEQSTPYIRTAVRKSFLQDNGIEFEEHLPFGEDQVFFFDLYPNSQTTALISDKLYEYRLARDDSMTSQTNDDLDAKSRKHLPMTRRIFQAWHKRFGLMRYTGDIVSWSIEFVLYGLLCLPDQARNELLPEYRTIYLEFWSALRPESLGLPKYEQDILSAALDGKHVGNSTALRLRARYFLGKYGAKAVVGKALGMN